jgi:hypothetical protein
MPGDRLFVLGLAQAFQQADAGLIGVEGIDIVDHDEAAAMPIKLSIHAEGRGIALDLASRVAQRGADSAAFGDAGLADKDEEVEMAAGKGLPIPTRSRVCTT